MSTKALKAGMGSGLDLKMLYNKITQMTETRIKLKLMLNAINNGITTFNYDEEKKQHYLQEHYLECMVCMQKENIGV